jgi:iron complex outermembrane receptor protein
VDWHLAEKTTLTLGIRKTSEDKTSDIEKAASFADGSALTSTGNATADAIRAAQLGNLFGKQSGVPLEKLLLVAREPQLPPHRRRSLVCVCCAGEKSGAVQFANATEAPQNVRPENRATSRWASRASCAIASSC